MQQGGAVGRRQLQADRPRHLLDGSDHAWVTSMTNTKFTMVIASREAISRTTSNLADELEMEATHIPHYLAKLCATHHGCKFYAAFCL